MNGLVAEKVKTVISAVGFGLVSKSYKLWGTQVKKGRGCQQNIIDKAPSLKLESIVDSFREFCYP